MKYNKVIVSERGGPGTLKVIEAELRPPSAGEARVKILAAPVCAPDITARYGQSPLVPKPPFTPGYAFIGIVDTLGPQALSTSERAQPVAIGDRVGGLTAYGAYAEYIYWKTDQLIPVPQTVDPAEAVPLILNYIVAYHALHRWARVTAGDKVLIIGASGGIGTAFLQLGKLADLRMYGIASQSKHPILNRIWRRADRLSLAGFCSSYPAGRAGWLGCGVRWDGGGLLHGGGTPCCGGAARWWGMAIR